MKVNRSLLFKMIAEAMEDQQDYWMDKIVGNLGDGRQREDIVAALDLLQSLQLPDEHGKVTLSDDNVSKLSLMFLRKIFGLYKSFDGFNNDAQKKELKAIDELRDEILAKVGGHAQLPPDDYGEYVKSIVVSSDKPGTALMEINFDFHQVFMTAFGFPPPRSEEFKLWGGTGPTRSNKTLSLQAVVAGKDVEFEFWYDMQTDDVPLDPWFRFETMHDQDGYVNFTKGVISIDEGDDYSKRSSKEELPGALRSAMGIPWNDPLKGEWPELPLGSPPKEGSDIQGPDDPPFEGKRKLNRNFLFEVINEVLQENELSEKEKIEQYLHSNNGEDFVWGLEMCHMLPELCSRRSMPKIINSQVMSGKYAGHDWVFLLVKTEEEANDLYWYLKTMRPKSSMPSREGKQSYMFKWLASEGSPFQVDIDMDYEEGDYIVEIVLDAPEEDIQESLVYEEEDEEGKDQSTFQLMSSKLGAFISSPDIENFRSGWNLIEAIEGLISDDETNYLKDKLFVALSMQDLIEGNEDFAIEIVDSVSPKEERLEFEHMLFRELRAIGQYELAVGNALKDLNIDVEAMGEQLMLMTGGTIAKLEKAKARLLKYGEIENHFEIDRETGGLLVGPMAKQFATFEKKMEEIFGVTPRGDVDVGYGALAGLFISVPYPTKGFVAPIARNQKVSASVVFEYSRLTGYGLEITLYPEWGTSKPNQRAPGHDDYYGIWVSQWDEGPNIGKLEIGIQSEEDELKDNKSVQNDNGGYGFTKEEMKKKILELTGMDLDALN